MTDIDDLDDCPEPWRSEIERLREENERLRDALTQIEGCFSSVEAAAAVTRERITDALDGYLWDDSE